MDKTITVKGHSSLAVKADTVCLTLFINCAHEDYTKVMEENSARLTALNLNLRKMGFKKNALKTVCMDLTLDYDNEPLPTGGYKRILKGYQCRHELRLSFPHKQELLAKALSAICTCESSPEITVNFSAKAPGKVQERLLKACVADAKAKALALCQGSGATLGELVRIEQGQNSHELYSPTTLRGTQGAGSPMTLAAYSAPIEPEDIVSEEEVLCVWTLL